MIWHNEEADELASRIRNLLTNWKMGAICPNEFLAQLDLVVTEAKVERATLNQEKQNDNTL